MVWAVRVKSSRKNNTNFWLRISSGGVGVFHVKGGGGAKKFGMSLETQGNKALGWDIPRFLPDILGVCEKFRVGSWQNPFFCGFLFLGRRIFFYFLTGFFSFLWEKVPRRILQENPWQNPPKFIQQNSPTRFPLREAGPKKCVCVCVCVLTLWPLLVARYIALPRYHSCDSPPIPQYPSEGILICDNPPLLTCIEA